MQEDQQVKVTETTTQTAPGDAPATSQVGHVTKTQASGPPSGVVLERLIYLVVGILEVVLAIRFVLSLLGANKGNVFADFIFTVSGAFVQPFQNLFNYQTSYGISRFELETLVAMAVYAAVGAGLVALVRLPRRGETA